MDVNYFGPIKMTNQVVTYMIDKNKKSKSNLKLNINNIRLRNKLSNFVNEYFS